MTSIILIAVVFGGLLALIFTRKQDNTTPEEIAQATEALERAIETAELIVGRDAPHNNECRNLLAQARYCLQFSGKTSRLVVSAWMIKQKRIEGIGFANKAVEIALAAPKAS